MKLETLINTHYNQLNENDLGVIAYVLENLTLCQKLSIVDLAEKCHTSKSSIHRLTKKLGLSGFSEFKYIMKSTTENLTTHKSARELQLEDVEATIKLLKQSDMLSIVKEMHKAERIFGFGTGWGQRNALGELGRSLSNTGKHVSVILAKTEFELIAPHITSKDLVIIISLSGDTKGLDQNIQMFNVKKIPVLSITTLKNNYLAKMTPYNLYYHSTPIVCKDSGDIVSFITLNIVCDTLFRDYLTYFKD